MGVFVCFEGPDGVGKTTHAAATAEWLRGLGREVVEAREPGGTWLGEQIRNTLKADHGAEIAPGAELFLFMVARAQLWADVIRPALDDGKDIVMDRGPLSTMVYQGTLGDAAGVAQVVEMTNTAIGWAWPSLTILLDAHPGDLLERLAARGAGDRRDRQSWERARNLRGAYRGCVNRYPGRVEVVKEFGLWQSLWACRRIIAPLAGIDAPAMPDPIPGTGPAGPGRAR